MPGWPFAHMAIPWAPTHGGDMVTLLAPAQLLNLDKGQSQQFKCIPSKPFDVFLAAKTHARMALCTHGLPMGNHTWW